MYSYGTRFILVRRNEDTFCIADKRNECVEKQVDLGYVLYLIGKKDIELRGANFDKYIDSVRNLIGREMKIVARVLDKRTPKGYIVEDTNGERYTLNIAQTAFLVGCGTLDNRVELVKGRAAIHGGYLKSLGYISISKDKDNVITDWSTYINSSNIEKRSSGFVYVNNKLVEIRRETFGMLLAMGKVEINRKNDKEYFDRYLELSRVEALRNDIYNMIGMCNGRYIIANKETSYDISRECMGWLMTKGKIRNVKISVYADVKAGTVIDVKFGMLNGYNVLIDIPKELSEYRDQGVYALPREYSHLGKRAIYVYGNKVYVNRVTFGVMFGSEIIESGNMKYSDLNLNSIDIFVRGWHIIGKTGNIDKNEYRYICALDSDKSCEIAITEETLGYMTSCGLIINAKLVKKPSVDRGNAEVEEAVIKINIHGKEIIV